MPKQAGRRRRLPHQPLSESASPELVAHRGNAADFPENTLPALDSALAAGLGWVELDLQFSADLVPYVIHDATLERTTRQRGDLRRMHSRELAAVDAGEPARFGDRHQGTPLPRLEQFAALLGRHPRAQAFIELKRASLQQHGRAACIDRAVEALAPVAARCALISFDEHSVELARERAGLRIGWVLRDVGRGSLGALAALAPEFAFIDWKRLPDDSAPLPDGPWRWAVYEVTDARRALREQARGAALIESMAPLRLQAELRAKDPS